MPASWYPYAMNPLQFLYARRSVPSRALSEPGPAPDELRALLAASMRVPDHGKLTPWRVLLIRGDTRRQFGELLAQIHQRKEPDLAEAQLIKDRDRYNFAPLIVAVIARIDAHAKIP